MMSRPGDSGASYISLRCYTVSYRAPSTDPFRCSGKKKTSLQ